MRFAVTGASGFIGRALVERLIRLGANVRVLSRRESIIRRIWPDRSIEVFEADLATANASVIRKFLEKVEVLFHCAGEIRKPEKMYAVNSQGTLKLCQSAAGRIDRWIQLSSVGVYGPHRDGVVTERASLAPRGLYETTKTIGDLHVVATALKGGFSYTLIRPTIVFGPGMPNASLSQLIAFIKYGLFFFIGDKKASTNYIHIANVVDAMLISSRSRAVENRSYIVSDCRPLIDVVRTIGHALGKPNRFPCLPEKPVRLLARGFGKLPYFPLTESRVDALTGRAVYSTQRIEGELGYRHQVPTLEGIRQLVHALEKEATAD